MQIWIDTLGVLFIPYLIVVVASGILSMYYLGRTADHIRTDKRWVVFVPLIWILSREYLDDKGNYFRVRAAWITLLFCLVVLIGWLLVYG